MPMTSSTLVAILVSVLGSSSAQLALKGGMMKSEVQTALAAGEASAVILSIMRSPLVILGLTLYVASAIIWLGVLAKVEVSSAYPFLALGFVLIAALGYWLFDDAMTPAKLGGTALIVCGVLVLARG